MFASVEGYGVKSGWKKLYKCIPEHEKSHTHMQCYLEWYQMESRLKGNTSVNDKLLKCYTEREIKVGITWKNTGCYSISGGKRFTISWAERETW